MATAAVAFVYVASNRLAQRRFDRGTAERGPEKVERGGRWGRRKLSVVTDGATGKRSAVLNFYPYKTRIGSHNLPLATDALNMRIRK